MKHLLIAAMLFATGAGAAQASDAGRQPLAGGSQPAGMMGGGTSSDLSYAKRHASQYNTANGE